MIATLKYLFFGSKEEPARLTRATPRTRSVKSATRSPPAASVTPQPRENKKKEKKKKKNCKL